MYRVIQKSGILRFLHEWDSQIFSNPSGVNFMHRIDCAHSRSAKTLSGSDSETNWVFEAKMIIFSHFLAEPGPEKRGRF